MFKLLSKIIKPTSKNENLNRKEYILNILLACIITASFIANIIIIYKLITVEAYRDFRFTQLFAFIVLFSLLLFLYYLSKKGKIIISAYIFIVLLLFNALKTLYSYGVDSPAALLTCTFTIIITQILTTKRFAVYLTVFITLFIGIIGYYQTNNVIVTNSEWKQALRIDDIIVQIILLFIILIVSWLYNREIEKSYKALQKERDSLDVKVKKRTAELKKEQTKRVSELYHFYEFGQISAGIFHDLINKLQSVSFVVERLQSKIGIKTKVSKEVDRVINTAAHNLHNMERFVEAAQKQVRQGAREEFFSIIEEIKDCILIMQYKAKKENIKLEFLYHGDEAKEVKIFEDKFRFNQLLTNIISNAIDSYNNIDRDGRKCRVAIMAQDTTNTIKVVIQDWGKGIAQENLKKIFTPFFSTKGTLGLGLSTTKKIIEKNFKGTINIESEEGNGTKFTLIFPLRAKEKIT